MEIRKNNIRVKICCISSQKEASTAIQFGASALGLVGNMPSGPGIISDDLILEITQSIPPPIATFLLTSETTSKKIVKHHQKVNTNVIQIVDELVEGSYNEIREALPNVKLVQVIHVIDEYSVEKAIEISGSVDCLLLDTGNPNLPTKVLGGTGKTHDWKLSRKIKDSIQKPLFLAGGLNSDNVRQAIEEVEPFGIDVCSGVRSSGKLDPVKLELFFNSVYK